MHRSLLDKEVNFYDSSVSQIYKILNKYIYIYACQMILYMFVRAFSERVFCFVLYKCQKSWLLLFLLLLNANVLFPYTECREP